VDTVNRVVAQLIDTGHYAPPSLGIETDETLSQVIARRMGIVGAAVARVPRGSAGAKAGLRGVRQGPRGRVVPGDVITAVNGQPVGNVSQLLTAVAALKPGIPAPLTVLRGNGPVEIAVTPGKRERPRVQR
jgi:S1-C subfamily serine protease